MNDKLDTLDNLRNLDEKLNRVQISIQNFEQLKKNICSLLEKLMPAIESSIRAFYDRIGGDTILLYQKMYETAQFRFVKKRKTIY